MPLPRAPSTLARRIISDAFHDLEKIIAPVDAQHFPNTTIQNVRDSALEIEKQLSSRGSLRNMRRLAPLFSGLEHYSRVVDTLCNGTPFLPWIWAPITLILRISSDYVEALEKIIKAYSQIAESLKRISTLGEAFPKTADFQETIAAFYSDILRFHGHAYKFVKRSSWRIFFMTSWGRFQRRFEHILEDMKRHESLIDVEANACNIEEAQKMRQSVREWKEESDIRLVAMEKERTASHFESVLSWLRVDESDQLAIIESISAEAEKYPGTSSWIIENAKVKAWLRPSLDPPLLWIKGSPGTGKSVLAAQLLNFLRTARMLTVCHFCTYSYVSSISYEHILRSLLVQILRRNEELSAYVYNDYFLDKKIPTLRVLEQLLQTCVENLSTMPDKFERVWIVLDGLDECEASTQLRIISTMRHITAKASSSNKVACKVLVSSRMSETISDRLRKSDLVSLAGEKDSLDRSIRQYSNFRLQTLHRKLEQLYVASTDVNDIVEAIVRKADGMFLYARLVLDFISSNIFYEIKEIKHSVNQLPEQLASLYREISARMLANLDKLSVERLKCMLGWIAFSKRPLKRLEFMSAVTFSSGRQDALHLVPQFVLDVISPLVEERHDSTLGFIHVSVKDFLQDRKSPLLLKESDSVTAHGIAATSCLLSGINVFGPEDDADKRRLRVVKGLHAFHIYATDYWTEYLLSNAASLDKEHVSSMPASPTLIELANNLATRLDQLCHITDCREKVMKDKLLLDTRLSRLEQHPSLQKCVAENILARSPERLLLELSENHEMKPPANGLSLLLALYRETLKYLLALDDFPGISASEFEYFKSQFRTSAFTCRITSCPRATVGFESAKLCTEHEMSHIRKFPCTYSSCEYPPFPSKAAMQTHFSRLHARHTPRPSIRNTESRASLHDTEDDVDSGRFSHKDQSQELQQKNLENTPLKKQELVLLDDFFNEPMEEVDASLNTMIGQQKLHLHQLLRPNLLNTRINLDVPLLPQLVPELEILKQQLRPELVNLLGQQLEELSQFSDYAQQQRLSAQEEAQNLALQFGMNLANAIGYLHGKLQQKSEYHEREIGHWRQSLEPVLAYLIVNK